MRINRGTLIKAFAAVAFVTSSFGSLHAQDKPTQDKVKQDTTELVVDAVGDPIKVPVWADRYPDLYDDYLRDIELANKQYDSKVDMADANAQRQKARSRSTTINQTSRQVGQVGRASKSGGGIDLAEGIRIGGGVLNTIGQNKSRKAVREANQDKAETSAEISYSKRIAQIEKQYDTKANRLDMDAEREVKREETEAARKAKAEQKNAPVTVEDLKQQAYDKYVQSEIKHQREPKSRAEYDQMLKDNAAKHQQQQLKGPGNK